MKRMDWMFCIIIAASLIVAGCGGGGGNGVGPVEPDPETTGEYGLEFTVLYEDGTSTEGVKLVVAGPDGTKIIPVSGRTVKAYPLDRDVEYEFSFLNQEGELIELNFGGEEVGTSFSLFLAEGEHLDKLNIPVFTLMPKVIPPTTGTMVIITNPPGATVWVDGEEQPTLTPVEFTKVPPGLREVRVLLDGYQEQAFSVEVFIGEAAERNVALVKVSLPIDSFPTEPTAFVLDFIPRIGVPNKIIFYRQGHTLYLYNDDHPRERGFDKAFGTISDDGDVEMQLGRKIFKGKWYPKEREIIGDVTNPEDPEYHRIFRIFEFGKE